MQRNSQVSESLATTTHVFIRRDTVRKPLQPPNDGPVLSLIMSSYGRDLLLVTRSSDCCCLLLSYGFSLVAHLSLVHRVQMPIDKARSVLTTKAIPLADES